MVVGSVVVEGKVEVVVGTVVDIREDKSVS